MKFKYHDQTNWLARLGDAGTVVSSPAIILVNIWDLSNCEEETREPVLQISSFSAEHGGDGFWFSSKKGKVW